MSFNSSAEYAAKDKIETLIVEAFREAEKEKALSKPMPKFCLKTILLATVFVMLVSGVTACATCLMMLR